MKALVTIPIDWSADESRRAWLADQQIVVAGESHTIIAYGSRDGGGTSELYIELDLDVELGEPPDEPEHDRRAGDGKKPDS